MRVKKLSYLAILAILILLHTAVNTFVPNLMLNYLGIAITSFVALQYSRKLNDEFLIILLFYILSHYEFANTQGGVQNIAFFVVLVFSNKMNSLKNQFTPLSIFAVLVFFSHIAGLVIKSDAPLVNELLGTLSLVSYLGVFLAMSTLSISKRQFGLFVRVATIMMSLMLLSQINTRFGLVKSASPIIGYSEIHNQVGQLFRSIIGSSPITAEFAFLNLTLGIGLLATIRDMHQFDFGRLTLTIYVFVSLAVMLLTTNRSTVFLSIAAVSVIMLTRTLRVSKQSLRLGFYLIFLVGFLLAFSSQLGLDPLVNRLIQVDIESVSIDTVESGESINRSVAFELGNAMLARENWLIGYGWRTYQYNRVAWFGSRDQSRADPHSLFYALPMLFGWIGSFAFLMIVISPVYIGLTRLYRKMHHDYDSKSISRIFVLIFVLFMINGLKQGFIASPNYFFIIMVWIGMAVSVQTYGLSSTRVDSIPAMKE